MQDNHPYRSFPNEQISRSRRIAVQSPLSAMPAKPAWYGRLDEIVAELEALPCPWITRNTVEFLLGC